MVHRCSGIAVLIFFFLAQRLFIQGIADTGSSADSRGARVAGLSTDFAHSGAIYTERALLQQRTYQSVPTWFAETWEVSIAAEYPQQDSNPRPTDPKSAPSTELWGVSRRV